MTRTLAGRTILVTRPRNQAGSFSNMLAERGATVIESPTIEVVPLDPAPLDAAIQRLESYDWLIFTSVNGAEVFFQRIRPETPLPPICSIGPATTRRIRSRGGEVALQPELYQAEGVLEALARRCGGRLSGKRFLLPRARVARELLPDRLTAAGAKVDVIPVYETVAPPAAREHLRDSLRQAPPDLATFTSSSTVRNFWELAGDLEAARTLRCAVIGPVTRDAARDCGLEVVCMPERSTVPDLVEAIEAYFLRAGAPAESPL